MEIVQKLIDNSKYKIKCPYSMVPIGICVHNTANDASARNEIAYMSNNNSEVSYHIAVDDKEAIQAIPFNRNAWHAGDGSNGEGNRKYISIEICYSKSGGERFNKAEINTARLIAQLLKERNWGIERVKKHQDFSGKYCPHRTLDLGWERFKSLIEREMGVNETMAKTDKTDKRYNTLDEIPSWGKDIIKGLVERGSISGDGTNLNLSEDMIRIYETLRREGVLSK